MPINNSLASLPSASYPAGNLELARVATLDREIFISRTRASYYEHTCSWIMIVGAFCREGEVSLSRGKSFWPHVVSRWGKWVTQVTHLIHRPLCDVTLRGTCTAPLGHLFSSKVHKGPMGPPQVLMRPRESLPVGWCGGVDCGAAQLPAGSLTRRVPGPPGGEWGVSTIPVVPWKDFCTVTNKGFWHLNTFPQREAEFF